MSRRVHLNRLLSKRGVLTRSQANLAILAGRVTVNGHVVRSPGMPVDAESSRVDLDGRAQVTGPRRTILFHKPRGVMTTKRDPQGRTTIYDLLGETATGLVAVGRLDWATSGLLLLTSDTELADRISDPTQGVSRIYVVTVRGRVNDDDCLHLTRGVAAGGERLKAAEVTLRKSSGRESHLVVTLTEGKNREVRRLLKSIGHEVTRLKRVAFGGLTLGDLAPGEWRELNDLEIDQAFHRLRSNRDAAAKQRRSRKV